MDQVTLRNRKVKISFCEEHHTAVKGGCTKIWKVQLKKKLPQKSKSVGPNGFEPMTSALSKQRSKPTELRTLEGAA
jgi:hypothetical protein